MGTLLPPLEFRIAPDLVLSVNVYTFTLAVKACLRLPLHSSLAVAGLFSAHWWKVQNTDPFSDGFSKVQSSQGIAWLERGRLLQGKDRKLWGQGVLSTLHSPSL